MSTAADAYRSARKAMTPGRSGKRARGKAALDDEQLEEVKEAFNLFDTEGAGTIDPKELKAAHRALGFTVKKAEVRKMLSDMAKDDRSVINFDEFCEMVYERMNGRDEREEIMKVFALFDEENKGKISFRNLKKVSNELGEGLTDDELMEMIEEADRTGDGCINREEFYRIMKKRGCDPLDDLDSDEDEL